MTNTDTTPKSLYIVKDAVSGKQVHNPYAADPLAPTSYAEAERLWRGIRHYQGTDYFIHEVPTDALADAWAALDAYAARLAGGAS